MVARTPQRSAVTMKPEADQWMSAMPGVCRVVEESWDVKADFGNCQSWGSTTIVAVC